MMQRCTCLLGTLTTRSCRRAHQPCFPSNSSILGRETPPISRREFNSSTPLSMGLEEFRDTASYEERTKEQVGRQWSVKELRRKSFEDLHRLWYVLYKEKNMLLTEMNLARRKGYVFPQPDRRRKVQKSMGAIKQVLGERKRDKIAQHALKMNRLQELGGEEEDDEVVQDDEVVDDDDEAEEEGDDVVHDAEEVKESEKDK